MKIHYISNHSILEYDEVQLLLDLGHEVFSNGAYIDPAGHITLPRPGLKPARYYSKWAELARTHPKTNLPDELIEPFDLIIVMHQPDVIRQNWKKLEGKQVIWRTIGQSTPHIEKMIQPMRQQGLKIVRYSPKERNIKGYQGEDAMIRFYKDENEYKDWYGNSKKIVNFSQSLKGRRDFCHYDEIMEVIKKFDGIVYGPGNEDLGQYNGGQIPYEMQLEVMRDARAMIYGGTWPASYTLSFIEALMIGLPVVAISKKLAHIEQFESIDFYEVDELLAEIDGLVCNTTEDLVNITRELIDNPSFAKNISERQRALALKYFSKEVIQKQWKEFLESC